MNLHLYLCGWRFFRLFSVFCVADVPGKVRGKERFLGKEGRAMPDKTRSGTGKVQTRYEDLAGILMAISVVSRRLARKLLRVSLEAGKGGRDGNEDNS